MVLGHAPEQDASMEGGMEIVAAQLDLELVSRQPRSEGIVAALERHFETEIAQR